jgi:hypothetical protein
VTDLKFLHCPDMEARGAIIDGLGERLNRALSRIAYYIDHVSDGEYDKIVIEVSTLVELVENYVEGCGYSGVRALPWNHGQPGVTECLHCARRQRS